MKFRNIIFHLFMWVFCCCCLFFYISCIQRESVETISIDVDLQKARDTFEKLTKTEWISYMVMANIYLRNRATDFLYRNHMIGV